MKNKKIIITGGTGYIAQRLAYYFGKENDVVLLSRLSNEKANNLYNTKLLTNKDGYRVKYVQWDARNLDPGWLNEINGSDLVINLAGKSVNCRYHRKQKHEIIQSRVDATTVIGEAIRSVSNPPSLWINASSATVYRHRFDAPNDEDTGEISDLKKDNMPFNIIDHLRYKKNKLFASLAHGKNSPEYAEPDLDFSIKVVKEWEKKFFEQETSTTRKIALRTAITLGAGGVITPFLNLCKFGMGGKHGNGEQMFSWVHEEDLARMITWLFDKKDSEGIYNCVAPGAVTNKEFMRILRKVTDHKLGLPAPTFMLEFGSFLIRTETELMFKSRWVYPTRALNEGFQFKFSELEPALKNIIEKLPRKAYHLF